MNAVRTLLVNIKHRTDYGDEPDEPLFLILHPPSSWETDAEHGVKLFAMGEY